MTTSAERWIATVDERLARLFVCSRTPRRSWRAEEQETLRNPWEDYHEHARPSILGSSPSGMPPQESHAAREAEEERRRFARDVSAWLVKQAERSPDGLVAFAAPRFLGLLRPALDGAAPRVQLVERELVRLRPHELVEHPAVKNVLSSPPPNGPGRT